jgi:hypothetical protein
MNSREQFERWVQDTSERFQPDFSRRGLEGDYVHEQLQFAYLSWSASRDCATPEWEHAPDWANWLAMDPDGRWYWHEKEPEAGVVRWRNPWGSRVTESGWTLGRSGWTETLERRP